MKRAPLGAGVYEEVDKQDTQTDGHTKHYQELDLANIEWVNMQLLKVDYIFVRTNAAVYCTYVAVKSVLCVSEHSLTYEHTVCT